MCKATVEKVRQIVNLILSTLEKHGVKPKVDLEMWKGIVSDTTKIILEDQSR